MNILLPVDFSEASLQAAGYAAQLAAQYKGSTLLLMHAADTYEEDTDDDTAEQESEWSKRLQVLQNDIFARIPISMRTVLLSGAFADCVGIALDNNPIDLVVMGVNAAGKLKRNFVENHAMAVVELGRVPVLVIPPGVGYKPLERVAIAVKLEEVLTHLPVHALRDLAKMLEVEVHVVNVNPEHYISLTEAHQQEQEAIAAALDVPTEFEYLRMYDIDDSLRLYCRDKQISVLVTVSDGKMLGLVGSISHTARMSYKSELPLLVVPSEMA